MDRPWALSLLACAPLLILLSHPAVYSSPTGASIFEFDQDEGDWYVCDDCCRSEASLRWDALDWGGPYSQGSLLLEADLVDGDDQTECRVGLQSGEFDGNLPPGTGKLGNFSFGIGAFACWVYVPDSTSVGPEGLKVRLFVRTGDSENHPSWAEPEGWNLYYGEWGEAVHGWNRVPMRVDHACHYESGQPVWGEVEFLDVVQAVGVELASSYDQSVSVHVDHYFATSVFAAGLESSTWCGTPGGDCNGLNTNFDVRMELAGALPDTLDLKGASITIQWRAHQLELIGISEGGIWDAACKTINNAMGTAQIDCACYAPAGARASPGDLLATFVFEAERAGRCPYWITSLELRDPENFDILPDTTAGALGADYWYYLGDFTGDAFDGYSWNRCPDRDVDVFDLNVFSIHYGLADADPLFDCRTDIGPTSTGWIHGIPLLDGVIDYDDLSIFADAYAYQSGEMGSPLPPEPGRGWESLRASVTEGLRRWNLGEPGKSAQGAGNTLANVAFSVAPAETSIFLGDSVWVEMRVSGNMGSFKTYEVIARYDPGVVEVLEVRQGPLFFDSPYETFFRNRSAGDSLDVIDSILGAGLTVGDPGTILRVLFRGIAHGTSPVHLDEALAANVAGLALPSSTVDGTIHVIDLTSVGTRENQPDGGRPGLTAAPNPTGGSSTLTLSLPDRDGIPSSGIEVFDVRGRRVRRMEIAGGSPVPLSVEWDGLDEDGDRVPAGVYFAVCRVGTVQFRTKVILAN